MSPKTMKVMKNMKAMKCGMQTKQTPLNVSSSVQIIVFGSCCVQCHVLGVGGGSILEAKFQTFEKRQEKVERQLETNFDSLQNQLRQVLMQFQVPGRSLLPARHHLPSYKSIYDSGHSFGHRKWGLHDPPSVAPPFSGVVALNDARFGAGSTTAEAGVSPWWSYFEDFLGVSHCHGNYVGVPLSKKERMFILRCCQESHRQLGVTCWQLAFEEDPKVTKFVVKFNSQLHEILLTQPGVPTLPKQGKKQTANKSAPSRHRANQSQSNQAVQDDPVAERVGVKICLKQTVSGFKGENPVNTDV